jgi:hypothetical protein
MIYIIHVIIVGRDPWATDEEITSAFSAPVALSIGALTVAVVLGHFLASSGRLLYQILLRLLLVAAAAAGGEEEVRAQEAALKKLYYCEVVSTAVRVDSSSSSGGGGGKAR